MLEKIDKEELRKVVEKHSRIRDLICSQFPPALIGYFSCKLWSEQIEAPSSARDDEFPLEEHDPVVVRAMELIHATIASVGIKVTEPQQVDEKVAEQILKLTGEVVHATSILAMSATTDEREFAALSNWIMVRGHHFSEHEEAFLNYTLGAQDDLLKSELAVTAETIAKEVGKFVNQIQMSPLAFVSKQSELMELAQNQGKTPDDFSENLDKQEKEKFGSLYRDVFLGEAYNLSKHTNLPDALLGALSFDPASDEQFCDGTEFSGTFLQTLPARLKPLIRIGEDCYCTETYFVRDAIYRTLEKAVVSSDVPKREAWNQNQKRMSEQAFQALLDDQLSGAQFLYDVHYPIGKGNWAEVDVLCVVDDMLICVEVKAGSSSHAAVSTRLDTHISSVHDLISKAHVQIKRFCDILFSSEVISLYDQNHNQIGQLCHGDFRRVVPINLTLESIFPFNASVTSLLALDPMPSGEPMLSISIDDLFVLRDLIRDTGELMHYLEVRLELEKIDGLRTHDEIDFLGGYIQKNRLDLALRDAIGDEEYDSIMFEGYEASVIRPYYSGVDVQKAEKPVQVYPDRMWLVLKGLEQTNSKGWLLINLLLRDLDEKGREHFDRCVEVVLATTRRRGKSYFVFGAERPVVVFSLGPGQWNNIKYVEFLAKSAALAMGVGRISVLICEIRRGGRFRDVKVKSINAPEVGELEFEDMQREATKMKLRFLKPRN